MSVYYQPPGTTIDLVRAVVLTPENANPASGQVLRPGPAADGMPAYGAVLDTRFITGGTTPWERPAASG